MIDFDNIQTVPMEKLTLGEIDFIEKNSGIPLTQLENACTTPFMIALSTVMVRRSGHPDFTLEQARAEITFEQAQKLAGGSEEE